MTLPRFARGKPSPRQTVRVRSPGPAAARVDAVDEARRMLAFALMHPGHVRDLVAEPADALPPNDDTES